jgi:hypothetical protein
MATAAVGDCLRTGAQRQAVVAGIETQHAVGGQPEARHQRHVGMAGSASVAHVAYAGHRIQIRGPLNLVLAMTGRAGRAFARGAVRQQRAMDAVLELLGLLAVAHAASLYSGAPKTRRAGKLDVMRRAMANRAIGRRVVALEPRLPVNP